MCLIKFNKEKILEIIEDLEHIEKSNKQSLESFINSYSKNVDRIIIDTASKEKIEYKTGKITLHEIDNENMQFSLELYFENKKGSYIKKELQSNVFFMNDYLNTEAIEYLSNVKSLCFDIETPEKNK